MIYVYLYYLLSYFSGFQETCIFVIIVKFLWFRILLLAFLNQITIEQLLVHSPGATYIVRVSLAEDHSNRLFLLCQRMRDWHLFV